MRRLLFHLAVCGSLPLAAQSVDVTLPPSTQRAILTLHAEGAQVYSCQQTPAGFAWLLQAPAARLFNAEGREVGTHGDGPSWTLEDSSSVSGIRVTEAPSAEAGSIPGLLLQAVNPRRKGVLTRVEYIRRTDTKGGAAPSGGCNGPHEGEVVHVPYTATYIFYSSQPAS